MVNPFLLVTFHSKNLEITGEEKWVYGSYKAKPANAVRMLERWIGRTETAMELMDLSDDVGTGRETRTLMCCGHGIRKISDVGAKGVRKIRVFVMSYRVDVG